MDPQDVDPAEPEQLYVCDHAGACDRECWHQHWKPHPQGPNCTGGVCPSSNGKRVKCVPIEE